MQQQNRRRNVAIYIFVIVCGCPLYLSACSLTHPLMSEKEVLSMLSDRYNQDFIIADRLAGDKYDTELTKKSRMYKVSLESDRESVFWAYQQLRVIGGVFPDYGNYLEDTYAYDYYIRRFYHWLEENSVDFVLREFNAEQNRYLDVGLECLDEDHLQGRAFIIFVTEADYKERVEKISNFINEISEEYPLNQPGIQGVRTSVEFHNISEKEGFPFNPFETNLKINGKEILEKLIKEPWKTPWMYE